MGKLNDEYESSGLKGIVDNYGLDVVLMMLSSGEYGDRLNEAMTDKEREDKLQQAKRGGGKEKPLRKLAATGKKADSLKEESRFPTQADIDDIENSGNIDIAYDKAMKLLKSLMNKSVSFSDVREGTWSSGTYNEIGRFIQDVKNLKDKYYNIVGNDDVFDGLDRAEESAREMMINAPENRSDLSEGFRDPEDNYGFDESPEYEIDDYEIGDQVVVTRGSSNDLGIVTKVDIPNNLVYVSWNPNRPSDESQAFNPGEVTFPGSPGRLREDEEPTKAELKKKDSVATISNKLQKLTAKMKKKAKEFKEAEGKAKDKIKDELKDMTAEKKKLEKSL